MQRYQTFETADASWRYTAPREANALGVPAVEHLFKDGPWRRMAADYRLFLDEIVGERYAEARRLVKSIDPHHPVSFRMQFSGDPTHAWGGLLPYDFYGLRNAVDIWEPEAYGRIGDWERVKPGRFTAAYARLCDPNKPVLWAEMGNSVWDMQTMALSPKSSLSQPNITAISIGCSSIPGRTGLFSGGIRVVTASMNRATTAS